MIYRDIFTYNLISRRVRLPRGPGEIKYLTVDGENLIFDGHIVQKPKYNRNFKVNRNSFFIYPLRYDAKIDVTYEVPEVFTMEQIQEMAAKFWISTGRTPTHLLMTTAQQNDFSLSFAPKERTMPGNRGAEKPNCTSVCVAPGVMIDIIAVAEMRSGHHNPIEFPKMVRIEE